MLCNFVKTEKVLVKLTNSILEPGCLQIHLSSLAILDLECSTACQQVADLLCQSKIIVTHVFKKTHGTLPLQRGKGGGHDTLKFR